MSVPWALPDNLARFRKARDLSQARLAAAAGISVDTLARIERAERQMTRPTTVDKLAAALGVTPSVLLGIPSPTGGVEAAGVAELRRSITVSTEIPGLADFNDPEEVVPLETLNRTAHHAWRAYVDGRHAESLHTLPALLADARRLAHATDEDHRATSHRVLATAYRLGAGLAGRFGLDDLVWTSAERALHAASTSDSPELERAISIRYLGVDVGSPGTH